MFKKLKELKAHQLTIKDKIMHNARIEKADNNTFYKNIN